MRAVLQVFENYQKARVNFVQTVAEVRARRPTCTAHRHVSLCVTVGWARRAHQPASSRPPDARTSVRDARLLAPCSLPRARRTSRRCRMLA